MAIQTDIRHIKRTLDQSGKGMARMSNEVKTINGTCENVVILGAVNK